MKKGSTLLLKVLVSLIGIAVLFLCLFVLPRGIMTTNWGGYRTLLVGMYVPAFPFFIGVYHTLKLLSLIDRNKAFSSLSRKSLSYIKYSALAISVMYGAGLPYIFRLADQDDAPGVVLLGIIFTFAPLIISVFSALLQKMIENALYMKSENDLTV